MPRPSKTCSLELPFGRGAVEVIEYSDAERLCANPLVSVVMPTYAHEKWLKQSIEGVVSQRAPFALELIVGEDCSPDATMAIALEMQEKHPDIVRVVTSTENVRGRRNVYRCERLCRGKYVAYCEGDDYWTDPEKITKQVDYLEEHPECGLVYTNADSHRVLSGQWTRMAMPQRPELCDSDDPYIRQLTGACIIWPLTVCLRKDLLDLVTRECPEVTDESLPMGDTTRFLEMARRTGVHYMPISTATRNLLPESATNFRDIRRKGQFIAGSAKVTLHYLEKYPVPERYDRQVRRWVHLRELEYAYLCGDADRSRRAFVALREKRISVPPRYRLYCLGALNPVTRVLIRGYFATLTTAAAVRNIFMPSHKVRSR